jgi:hypothetical protein
VVLYYPRCCPSFFPFHSTADELTTYKRRKRDADPLFGKDTVDVLWNRLVALLFGATSAASNADLVASNNLYLEYAPSSEGYDDSTLFVWIWISECRPNNDIDSLTVSQQSREKLHQETWFGRYCY